MSSRKMLSPSKPPKASRYPNLKHIQHKLEQLWTAQISPRQSEHVRVCLCVLLSGYVCLMFFCSFVCSFVSSVFINTSPLESPKRPTAKWENIDGDIGPWSLIQKYQSRGQNWGRREIDFWHQSPQNWCPKYHTDQKTSHIIPLYKIKKYQTPQVCRGSGLGPIRYHCPLSWPPKLPKQTDPSTRATKNPTSHHRKKEVQKISEVWVGHRRPWIPNLFHANPCCGMSWIANGLK